MQIPSSPLFHLGGLVWAQGGKGGGKAPDLGTVTESTAGSPTAQAQAF